MNQNRPDAAHPPEDYPWVPASVLLQPLGSVAPPPNSRLVVAVGSNAAPSVLRRKLDHLGDAVEPALCRVRVANITVGHSAHVAARGYIPAAPVHAGQGVLTTVGAWLKPSQTEALDRTEPNYDRRTVNTHDHPLQLADRLPGVPTPDEFDLYVSRHGVLADPDGGAALPFGDQPTVLAWLARRLGVTKLDGPPADVCARLATGDLGARVTGLMRAAGLSQPAWPSLAADGGAR
ncbi:hypothetical protein GP2_040_00260 [Gordonia paraffinivorans NBRC 108238]|uniref:Uncharacterized protein n=1 Tax=Gordonia paraffinivorans NBRC 108238 TaxID=1223543 RepID=A0ABQ0IQ85_9ACTN|nr:hypothetical protein [Gordonia paraffinivorans]GAC85734.1 hypothetical protein GP2_040_00260 [Gordonia paraffinivorans NBRC 108238]